MRRVKGPCQRHGDGVYYQTVRFFVQRKRHCRCVWSKIAATVHVCKCRRPQVQVRCHRDNEVHTLTIRYKLHPSRRYCCRRSRYRVRLVKCRGPQKFPGKCLRKNCLQPVKAVYHVSRNCRCRRVVHLTSRRCCCPPSTHKHNSCSADGKTKIVRWFSYHLASGRCFLVMHVTTARLNCESLPPVIKIGPCKGEVRRRRVTAFRTRSCHCVPVVRVRHITCRCAVKNILQLTPCKKGQVFTTDYLLSRRFDPITKRCVLIKESRRRRCRCSPPTKHSSCIRHTVIRTDFISYRLQYNSCIKKFVRKERPAGRCTRRPAMVREVIGKCTRATGFYQVDRLIYLVARNCRCKRIVKTRRWPCDCRKLYPPRKTLTCHGHRRQLLVIHEKVSRGRKCMPKTTRSAWSVYCFKRWTVRGHCDHSNWRWVLNKRQVARRCHCVWRVHSRWRERCHCPHPIRRHRCLHHRVRRLIMVSFRRCRGRCCERRVIRDVTVACKVGRTVRRSACRNGRLQVVTTIRRLRKCQCLKRRQIRVCRCRCRKGYRRVRCLSRMYREVVHVLYLLRRCGCIKRRVVSKWKVQCLPSRTRVGKCLIWRGHDRYRPVQKLLVFHYRCKCRYRRIKKLQLCACAPHVRRWRHCEGDSLVVTTVSKRVQSGGRCVRIRKVLKNKIICDPRPPKSVCRSGVRITTFYSALAVRCRCRPKVRVVKSRCRCDPRPRRVKMGVCSKRCWRTDVYSVQKLVRYRCVTRRFPRRVICCCPPKSRKRKCRGGMWKILMISFRLVGGRCVKRCRVQMVPVRCPTVVRRKLTRMPDGRLITRTFFYRRRGCRCILRSRVKVTIWACPHKKLRVTCWRHRHWRRLHVSYKLVGNSCRRSSRVDLVPVHCHFRLRVDSPCRPVRYGLARTTLRVWYVKKHCHCHQRRHTTVRLCSCTPPRVHRKCDATTGHRSVVYERFVPTADGRRCRRVRRVAVTPTRCNDRWRHHETTPCFEVEHRQVRHACRCKTELRKIPKKIRCPKGRRSMIKCNPRNCVGRCKIVWYTKLRCRCVKHVRIIIRPCCDLACPPTSYRKGGKCRRGLVRTTIIRYTKVRGLCRKRVNVVISKLRCPKSTELAVDRCVRLRRKHLRTFYLRRGCRCLKRRKIVTQPCRLRFRRTDLIFLVDSRMHDSSFHLISHVRSYITRLAASLPANRVRIAVVRVGARSTLIFPLGQRTGPELRNLRAALSQPWRGTVTNMSAAVKLVLTRILPRTLPGVIKRLVVISMGEVVRPRVVVALARRLRKKGVVISTMAVRAGQKGKLVMQRIASKPKKVHVAVVSRFLKLRFMPGFVRHGMMKPITHY